MLSGLLCNRGALLLFGVLTVGCDFSSSSIEIPDWDPAAVADRALAAHDPNKDGKLSRDELKSCPGLLSAVDDLDQDRDSAISADEIKSHLQEIKENEAALVEVTCIVTRNNQPLEGAKVEFVPEPFMGQSFDTANGVTERDGVAFPTVADEKLPAEYRGRVHGVHCGIYRVVVTHPEVAVPAKYNTQTELGLIVTRRHHDTVMVDF